MPVNIPTHLDLLNPVLQALQRLGGSGTVEEINANVLDIMHLPQDIADEPHGPGGYATEVEYRLGWARNYLKNYGLIENSERGVWALVPEKRKITEVDPQEVARSVRRMFRERRASQGTERAAEQEIQAEAGAEEGWKARLLTVLTAELSPDAFERLSQRLLRECGLVHVEVTGRSGDGGIDGKGIMRLGDVLSFHVVFQCKRYAGSVSAGMIRDFRGAMVGRADKGLFITTGSFTRDAVREATRDGAPPIDLIDGDRLSDLLKRLKLGVRTETVERVSIDTEWFVSI